MNGIFVTATGTDVGKTYISALLVKWLREHGVNAGYYKPALSGGEWVEGELIPGDAAYVCKIAGLIENPAQLVSYCFEPAVSPHLAARLAEKVIELDKIEADFLALSMRYEFMVVEGCGGAACPLQDGENPIMLLDVMCRLGLRALIVSQSGLGAINHSVLTASYLQQNKVEVKGFILNQFDERQHIHRDNERQIERLTNLSVLACVPQQGNTLNGLLLPLSFLEDMGL